MRINGHRTSIALEAEFWSALACIAKHRGLSLPKLLGEIDSGRGDGPEAPSLASAVRVYVLEHKRPDDEAA
ncbi:MAG: ribbon-helix-helix domain-containing protein [Alphaproteobacteria bacterium]